MISPRARFWSNLAKMPLLMGFLFLAISFATRDASAKEVAHGEGSAFLAGAVIQNPHFQLSNTDPSIVVAVQFTIANVQSVKDVRIKVNQEGVWYPCELGGVANGWTASCDVAAQAQIRVSDMDELRVVTVQ